MGALLAYETARRLREVGAPPPVRLVVSAHRAPHLPYPRPPLHVLPPREFTEAVLRLGGTPREVAQHPELMEIVVPILRADMELCETYAHAPGEPLDAPITAYGGMGDPYVPRDHLDAWRTLTRGRFSLRTFPGDHFFLHAAERDVLHALARDLEEALAPPTTTRL
jgi:medium-chain acyl-[acyl-carrier-protein] hydrolase